MVLVTLQPLWIGLSRLDLSYCSLSNLLFGIHKSNFLQGFILKLILLMLVCGPNRPELLGSPMLVLPVGILEQESRTYTCSLLPVFTLCAALDKSV